MAHNQDDHHGQCCNDHNADTGLLEPPSTDVAGKSLSDALRLSFRILSVIMIFVLIGFLASGVSFVDPQKVGVLKVFGKIVGTSPENGGLTYTWPYPVGDIEFVRVNERTMEVRDFWVAESADEAIKPMSERRTTGQGLRPGVDGALFTGDRNLLHAKLSCRYRIANPVAYMKAISHLDESMSEDKDTDLEEMIRSIICNSALTVAASRTADDIKNNKGRFETEIAKATQRQLNAILNQPDETDAVKVINITAIVDWPIRAQAAYREAQQAKAYYDATRSDAIKTANSTLNSAAGQNYHKLIRLPWQAQPAVQAEDFDLIGQYTNARQLASNAEQAMIIARQTGNAQAAKEQEKLVQQYRSQAERVIVRIDQLLMTSQIQGQASATIAEANRYRSNYIEGVKGRVKRFSELLAEYEKAPQLMLERHWADVRDYILQSKLVEKMYVTFDDTGKTVVRINRDPKIAKDIARSQMEADKEDRDSQKP